ncbi:uncharacterized protein LOC121056071 [Oryza brachyantha]|nr:uncharacterized protein LOC121056071 [Oryza brachyantha]
MESQEREEGDEQLKEKERLLDFLRAAPFKAAPPWFLTRLASLRATKPAASRRLPEFARSVDWRALRAKCVAWARHPMNAALLVWLAFVAGGVAFVFLLMTGALNSAVPDASRRRRWTEVANQVLNALFTIMCIYQHPRLCHHLAILLRWRAADVAELRSLYCKNGAAGLQSERLHVAFVVMLLHATCFAQYGYCALFWFFRTDTRPDLAVNLCMALGLGAPIVAGLYMVYGPLGRKIVLIPTSTDDEAAELQAEEMNEMAMTAKCDNNGVAVAKPAWAGGLFDLGDDPTVTALSLSCTFCVFGWNMERLGLGNMYVHVFTFALLCAAPVLVFAVAALNVHDDTLRFVVGATGALLSVLGLMYGGFWRAQMRRRFRLPADRWSMCGGRATAADYGKWLCCAPCALAQEVRTANLYDVEENVLYLREVKGGNGKEEEVSSKPAAMAPLEREGCVVAVDAPPLPIRIEGNDEYCCGDGLLVDIEN